MGDRMLVSTEDGTEYVIEVNEEEYDRVVDILGQGRALNDDELAFFEQLQARGVSTT